MNVTMFSCSSSPHEIAFHSELSLARVFLLSDPCGHTWCRIHVPRPYEHGYDGRNAECCVHGSVGSGAGGMLS